MKTGVVKEIYSFIRHPVISFYKVRYYNRVKKESRSINIRNKYIHGRLCELVDKNKEIENQLGFFVDLVEQYEQGVEESPKYQLLLGENTLLKKRNSDLENLCGLLKRTVRDLNKANKENLKLWIRLQDQSYEEKANISDSKLSYIVIGGHGRIVAATPKFLGNFDFKKEEVVGRNYFNVLKSSDRPEFYKDMKKLFGESGKLEKTATIFDGKRKERHILFVRYEPENVPFITLDEFKNLKTTSAYFYTRVDVHEIGFLKKVGDAFRMFYKASNGEPKDIQEFIEYRHIEALKKKDAKFGEIAARMIARGVTKIDKIWESSETPEDFERRCEEFLLEKQKKKKPT